MNDNKQQQARYIASDSSDRIVVLAGGVFDLLHEGHIHYLAAARSLGNYLIVHVDGDAHTKRRKGDARPIIGVHERRQAVAQLDCVDETVTSDNDFDGAYILNAVRATVVAKCNRPGYTDTIRRTKLMQFRRYCRAQRWYLSTRCQALAPRALSILFTPVLHNIGKA